MYKILSALVFVLFCVIGCDDNPVGGTNDSFNTIIRVTDVNNQPMSGINISIRNKVISASGFINKTVTINKSNAPTIIQFTLTERCFADLSVYDLNNKLKERVVRGEYPTGQYQVHWNSENQSAVYKCRLRVSSDSLQQNILFQDSIYAVVISPDIHITAGRTDNTGKFQTNNKLLFPHLFDLPEIAHTSFEGPEVLDYFTLSDTVVIALSDESFSRTIYYEAAIKDGNNNLSLTWDEDLLNITDQNIMDYKYYNVKTAGINIYGIGSVVLTYFEGSRSGRSVILNWQTAGEQDNYGFEVERKETGTETWNSIGFVQGQGTTTEIHDYSFTDTSVNNGVYDYRLKQINTDDSFVFSDPISVLVEIPLPPSEWKLFQNYPNPYN